MKFDFIPDEVSKFDNAYDVLKERGFIEQSTDEDKIRELLRNEKVKFYIGFDPTADCLHVGHFMQVIIMMYMQKFGHTPVVLLGGGTRHGGRSFRQDGYAPDHVHRDHRTQLQPVQETF